MYSKINIFVTKKFISLNIDFTELYSIVHPPSPPMLALVWHLQVDSDEHFYQSGIKDGGLGT